MSGEEFRMKGYARYYQNIETKWHAVIEDVEVRPKSGKRNPRNRQSDRGASLQLLQSDCLVLKASKLTEAAE
jgi:hypothetical protein